MDRLESFLKVEGMREDRLCQIYAGIGLERDFGYDHDYSFLCLVAEQTLRAVRQSPLSLEVRADVTACVERWENSLGEKFGQTQ